MLELIFGVLTLSFGIYALSKGRLQLSKEYALEGKPARTAGILLVTAPIIGLIFTIIFILSGQEDPGSILGCSCYSIIGVLAFAAFQAWKSKKPPTGSDMLRPSATKSPGTNGALVPCPFCGKSIPKDAIDCVYCRREVYDALHRK